MRRKYGHKRTHLFCECAADECAVYLQYKKQDKDPGMPKALGEKRLRCREWMHRTPPSSPTHSEDEGDEQDSSTEVAAVLLGLASNNPQFNDQGDNVEGHEDDPTQVWEGDL